MTKKYHYRKELEKPAEVKEMAMKIHSDGGKSRLQLKAMTDVTEAVSEEIDLASKREDAGNVEGSREADAARVVE